MTDSQTIEKIISGVAKEEKKPNNQPRSEEIIINQTDEKMKGQFERTQKRIKMKEDARRINIEVNQLIDDELKKAEERKNNPQQ